MFRRQPLTEFLATCVLFVAVAGQSDATFANDLVVTVVTDACVSSKDAVQQSHEMLETKLLAELQRRQQGISAELLRHELPELMFSPSAQRTESDDEILKPFGTLHRRRSQVVLPEVAVRDWLRSLSRSEHELTRRRLWTSVATVIAWLVAPIAVRRWDRRTLGYHRVGVCGVTFCGLTLATVCGWLLMTSRI